MASFASSLTHRLMRAAVSHPVWRKQISMNSHGVPARRGIIQFSTMSSVASAAASGEKITYIRLNNLQDNPGATKKKRRVGRGIGSSKGKTSGKGHKGQRARNRGGIPNGFEGGQTPLWKVLPKRGFNNKRHQVLMTPVNLGTIQDYIDMGRLLPTDGEGTTTTASVVTVVDLIRSGMLRDKANLGGIKLLSKGKERFRTPLRLEVNRASEAAIEAAEAVGGQVTTVHHNRLALRSLIRPEKFAVPPKLARPPPKYHAYYTNWKNRGYLCPEVQMRNWLYNNPHVKDSFEEALKTQNEQMNQTTVATKEE